MHQGVFDKLVNGGHFYDPVAREVENSFVPWLHNTVVQKLDQIRVANRVCEDLIRSALGKIPAKIEDAKVRREKEAERDAAERKLRAEREAQEKAQNSDDDDSDAG